MPPAPRPCDCRKQQRDARHLFTSEGTEGRSMSYYNPGNFTETLSSFQDYIFRPKRTTRSCEMKREKYPLMKTFVTKCKMELRHCFLWGLK